MNAKTRWYVPVILTASTVVLAASEFAHTFSPAHLGEPMLTIARIPLAVAGGCSFAALVLAVIFRNRILGNVAE